MAEKIDEIELDLEKVVLEGWENPYDLLNVLVLREAIKLGHELPRVDVVEHNGVYRLISSEKFWFAENYGGHGRSVAFFQEKKLLKCNLYTGLDEYNREEIWGSKRYLPISEFRGDIQNPYCLKSRLKKTLNFLPNDVAKKFISDLDSVLKEIVAD